MLPLFDGLGTSILLQSGFTNLLSFIDHGNSKCGYYWDFQWRSSSKHFDYGQYNLSYNSQYGNRKLPESVQESSQIHAICLGYDPRHTIDISGRLPDSVPPFASPLTERRLPLFHAENSFVVPSVPQQLP